VTSPPATASDASVSLFYNADTTVTNYHRGNITGTSTNDAFFGSLNASGFADGHFTITKGQGGKPHSIIHNKRCGSDGSILGQLVHHGWGTATNLTSITLSSSVASSLAIGSYIKLWKIV
jgi:hypothetical protein